MRRCVRTRTRPIVSSFNRGDGARSRRHGRRRPSKRRNDEAQAGARMESSEAGGARCAGRWLETVVSVTKKNEVKKYEKVKVLENKFWAAEGEHEISLLAIGFDFEGFIK